MEVLFCLTSAVYECFTSFVFMSTTLIEVQYIIKNNKKVGGITHRHHNRHLTHLAVHRCENEQNVNIMSLPYLRYLHAYTNVALT